jgi:hypothetical protein
MSKNYLMTHHIEEIQLQIERIKFDKSLAHLLPKLNQELTRAINSLPEDAANKNIPVPNVYIGTLVINSGKPKMTIEDARAKWKERKSKNKSEDYIDFEDGKE